MSSPAEPRISLPRPHDPEEFARWVETLPWNDLHHYELLDGFVVRVPSPGWPNSGIAVQVMTRLRDLTTWLTRASSGEQDQTSLMRAFQEWARHRLS